MTTKMNLLLSFILFILATSLSYAGNRPGAATFSLGGGGYYFSSKRHMDNTGITFGILGFDFSQHWGIEALIGGMNTTSRNPGEEGMGVNGTLIAFDGIYHFSPLPRYCAVEPFVLFGIGALGLNHNDNDAHNQGNINAGIGAQFFANEMVAFRIEGRDFYTIVGGKNDLMADAGVTFVIDI